MPLGARVTNLTGTDFQKSSIDFVYDGLFAGILAAFMLKRIQQHGIRSRIRSEKGGSS